MAGKGKAKKSWFKRWCKGFLGAFLTSAILFTAWRLVLYFQSSGCEIFGKCTIAAFSLTGILSFVIYAIAEVIRK